MKIVSSEESNDTFVSQGINIRNTIGEFDTDSTEDCKTGEKIRRKRQNLNFQSNKNKPATNYDYNLIGNTKMYKCPYPGCSKTAKTPSNVTVHVRFVHQR